jgi:outer membrane protein OmpA-like peptidoglycan-associated protein
MGSRHVVVGTMLGVMLCSGLSNAESSARGQIEEFFRRATAILSEGTDARRARDDVRDLARPLFDGRQAARRALGVEWNKRTSAEREEFARIFTAVLERAYLDMVRARLPRNRPPAVRVVAEDITGRRTATVRSRVQAKDGGDVQIDYLMARPAGEWLVHDIVIDGVSLVENYGAQFAQVLRTSSYAELVGRLLTIAGPGEPITAAQPITASPPDSVRPEDVVVYFDTGRAELRPAGRRDLEAAALWLVANGQARALVEGHSDQRGDAQVNQVLAEHRAHALREYLVIRGVDADRLVIVPYGTQRPICQDPVDACWAKNRRGVVRLTP